MSHESLIEANADPSVLSAVRPRAPRPSRSRSLSTRAPPPPSVPRFCPPDPEHGAGRPVRPAAWGSAGDAPRCPACPSGNVLLFVPLFSDFSGRPVWHSRDRPWVVCGVWPAPAHRAPTAAAQVTLSPRRTSPSPEGCPCDRDRTRRCAPRSGTRCRRPGRACAGVLPPKPSFGDARTVPSMGLVAQGPEGCTRPEAVAEGVTGTAGPVIAHEHVRVPQLPPVCADGPPFVFSSFLAPGDGL